MAKPPDHAARPAILPQRSARVEWLLVAALLIAAPAGAAGLTEPQVRDFVARQQRDWNAGDLAAYFAGFRPDASFTDQYRTPAGKVVPYGTSTLAQARVQSRKFRATARVAETGQVLRVALAADGGSADVVSRVVQRTEGPKGVRIACAERRQRLVLAAGRLRSRGQTDTFFRCPR
jgi:hypothetical protein